MPVIPTFYIGLKIATEASRGVAPTASNWYQGGRWHDVITDGLPSLQDQKAIIFPEGHAGRRSINQQPPVEGRKWSDGGFNANVTADWIGLLFHAALGGASSNSVPSTDPTLLTAEPINATTKPLVLSSQPSDGGAILRFHIEGASTPGLIQVQGIDVYGNGASETISYGSAGYFYTRTSFSAIGASSASITTTNAADGATVSIDGFQYWEHVFSASDTNPTYSIEKHGDPQSGDARNDAMMHTAMVLQELSINLPAESRDGIFSVGTTWEGNPTAVCANVAPLNHASAMRIWPAWAAKVTRDGQTYNKVTNAAFTINSGNMNYRTAAGVQGPQGSFFGGREVTGSMDILADDAGEYNRWLGTSRMQFIYTITPSWKLTSSQNMSITASMTDSYIETRDEGDSDGMFSLSVDFRPIDNATDNVLKLRLINGVPGVAYGNSVA